MKKTKELTGRFWTNCDFWLAHVFFLIAFRKRLLMLVPLSDKLLHNWHFSSWFQFLHSWKWGHFHLWMLSAGSHFSLFILFFPKITPTKRQQNDRQNLDGFPETPRQSICEVVYIHLSNPTNNPKKNSNLGVRDSIPTNHLLQAGETALDLAKGSALEEVLKLPATGEGWPTMSDPRTTLGGGALGNW